MKIEIKMALAIIITIALLTVLPLSKDASAESSSAEPIDLWGWQGSDEIEPVHIGPAEAGNDVNYFTVKINDQELKYQTRLILAVNYNEDGSVVTNFELPSDISSMSVRFIDFGIDKNGDKTLEILNEYKVSQFDFYKVISLDFVKGYGPGTASEPFRFGVTVMHYDDADNPSSAHSMYINIEGRATVGKLDLDKYLQDQVKNSLVFNWHDQSIEKVIKKIKPSTIDDDISIETPAPKIGVDYYWVVSDNSKPVAMNVKTYKATAVALETSPYYEGSAKDRVWEITTLYIDPICDDLVYNGTVQLPQPTIEKEIAYYKLGTAKGSTYGKLLSKITEQHSLKLETDFKLDNTNGQMDANSYNGENGYSIKFLKGNDGNVCTSTERYSWEIQRKDIRDDFICNVNCVPITPDTLSIEYTGEPITLDSMVIVIDPDLKGFPRLISKSIGTFDEIGAKILIGYLFNPEEYGITYDIQINPGTYSITVTVDEKMCINYKGEAHAEYEISNPVPLIGDIHVNIVWTNGTLTSAMFNDSNTFIYPYEPDYKTYDDDMNYIGKTHPTVLRENLKLVILDARGNVVIDEIAGINEGTTESEWNHIEAYGTKGFKGCITGEFYVAFNNAYEIGSTFTEEGITYTITSLDNKTVSVTGYTAEINSAVAIPDEVNGFKVTKIGTKAFYGCKTITSVDLGENIVSVGVKAFANCTKLSAVVFDDALKTISAYAFYNCAKLTDVDFSDNVKTIGSYAFYKCNALKSVSFDSALKTVGTKAFTVTFEDASGKTLKQTAKVLAGKVFEGSSGVLKLVA